MYKPKISLTMIVKNEEHFLEDCIRSAEGAVDEIIIADTGSTDNTKEIAQAMGVLIYDFKWVDDFSAARNFAVSKATGDWILVLDADEELFSEDIPKIRNLSATSAKPVWSFRIFDTDIDNIYSHYRMFKSSAGLVYKGKFHEQPILTAENIGVNDFLATDIRILHKGYSDDVIAAKQKVDRNIKLFQNISDNDPDNAGNNFQMGLSYQAMRDYDKAIDLYRKVLADHSVEYPAIYKYLVQCYEAKKDNAKAIEIAAAGLEKYPDYVDLLFQQGLDLLIVKLYKKAIDNFKRCLKLPIDLRSPTNIPGSQGILAKLFLTLAVYELTRDPKLNKMLDDLLKELSIDTDALFFLGKHYKRMYGKEFAEKEIAKIANLEEPKVTRMIGILFER